MLSLCFPGMCAAEMKELFLFYYIFFAILLHFLDVVLPLLLIYAIAVELFDITLICLQLLLWHYL